MDKQQKLVLIISILGSFVAFLDGSVVNVALPAIARELGGGLPLQQWVVNAYLLTLGSFILLAGALSDLLGRKRIFQIGLIGFGVASVACAVAGTGTILVMSRALQGFFGALLVPSSLALIIAAFSGAAQGKAIGTWTAWTGMAFLVGPLLGGFLVDTASWRWVFAINVVPIFVTLWLLRSLDLKLPERGKAKLDVAGAAFCTIGLGAMVFALIEQTNRGLADSLIVSTFILGSLLFGLFLWHESRTANPMLPLQLFEVRNFSVGNLATTAIYASLAVATFLIVIFLQQVGEFTALQAGMSLLPVTILMFLLSPRFGAMAGKNGPRLLMAAGPLVASIGFLLLLGVGADVSYWTQIFPGVTIFGLGLAMTVAPLTTAVLADIKPENAGIGSAVNNAIARVAGLLATAAVGLFVGTSLDVQGFKKGIVAMAVLLIIGGIISAVGIKNPPQQKIALS